MKAFLCHSSVDKRYVDIVANRLGRARVEYDLMTFEPMVDFRDSIREALGRSEILVFFASQASLGSTWVKYEIQSADELVRQGRLRSAAAIVIDDATAVSDLPSWMRQARVDRVRRPTRAARIVSQHLHRSRGLDDIPLFIGRERFMAEFSKVLIGRLDELPPRTIVLHGLPGTGRRTFLHHAFKNFLSLELGPLLVLQPTDDLDALHAALLGELGELDSRVQLENAITRFRASSQQEKAQELARLVAGLNESNFAPVIVDNGGLLQADGQYVAGVVDMLRELAAYKDAHLALVHARKPLVDRELLRTLQGVQFRVQPIELQATALLVGQALRRAGISANLAEINELAEYMDGYPPAVYLAVSLIKEYGLSTIIADKSMLVDFRVRTFAQLLPRLNLTDGDWSCLRVLASEPILPFEALATVLGLSATDMAAQLRRLIDFSLVTPLPNAFQIAPPIREAVFASRGILTDREFAKIAEALETTFWRNKDELPPMEIVNATVHAVSRGDVSRVTEFGGLVLPSTLYRAAKEKYDEGGPEGWLIARKLTERVLEIDRSHRRARILRFMILVRLGEWTVAGQVLSEIAATGDLEHSYLRGFLLWKRADFADAIDAFQGALRVGHTSVVVYHGLATCQWRSGWTDAALITIREGLRGRRPNKYLLDLGVQVAVQAEQYAEAAGYLQALKRLKEDADYHHRAAMLLSAQREFAEALLHADLAVQSSRVRFEAFASRIDILIELEQFDRATTELNALDARYKAETLRDDIRIGLRCKLLLREQNWRLAEQVLNQTTNRTSPHYLGLRFEVLNQKTKDSTVSPGEREAALRENDALAKRLPKRVSIPEGDALEPEEGDEEVADEPAAPAPS